MTALTSESAERNNGSIAILVVDDVYENRYLLEVTLKSKGYQVITANNGQEALEYLQSHPVHLVISDILMPKMDGFTLCREMKKTPDLKNIPFVFYTASYTSDEDRRFGLNLGADRYILKPQDNDVFLTEITELLAESHDIIPSEPTLAPDATEEYLTEYSERIFDKLETKIKQLEKINQDYENSQQSLRESEEKFRELFENISSGVVIYDVVGEGTDFILADINKASEKLDHVRREDVVGRSISEVFPGVEAFGLPAVLRRVHTSGIPEHIPLSEYRDERIQGWREKYVYRLPSGKLVVVYDDVTEKKLAEDALIESEYKYHEIFDNITEAVYLIDVMSDNAPGNFVEVNNVACRRSGYSRDELLTMRIDDLNTVPDRKEILPRVLALRTEQSVSFEIEQVRKDGSVFPVHVNARMIELRGRQFILSLVRDLTEESEARKREGVALRQIEQNLTQLAILNDEIRNPLAVITGIIGFREDETANPVLEQVRIIDDIVNRLDKGWLESEKIREYLRKHHDLA